MDLAELREEKMRKMQALEEEKTKTVLQRQMRILNKEKEVYAYKTNNYINKIQITLGFLQTEQPIELEKYLATQSQTVERKYARDEATVRELVKTTDIVRDLLREETEANKTLDKEILKVKEQEFSNRKQDVSDQLERNKFRVPSQQKMDSRVEHANKRYHIQRLKNAELKEKIDTALITRDIFCRQETKMEKELKSLYDKVQQVMTEAGHYYEERDRNEGVRMKLLEHLYKVKENCVKELQGLMSTLTEDKDMESFMRIKQKDKGGYIRDKRAHEKLKIKEMLKQRDEHSLIFDRIKAAIGKEDMQEIVQEFIRKEEDNFGNFNSIGELMDDNERLRHEIRDLSSDNVQMEWMDLELNQTQQEGTTVIQGRIDALTQRKEEYQKRVADNGSTLSEFYQQVKNMISVLKMDTSKMKHYNKGDITPFNITPIMTDIEDEVANVLRDFTMVELATRATMFSKSQHTSDQAMLMRRPSQHIKPTTAPRFTPLSISKHVCDSDAVKDSNLSLMSFQEAKDSIVNGMLEDDGSGKRRSHARSKKGSKSPHAQKDTKDAAKPGGT